jgi:hypothetical protein
MNTTVITTTCEKVADETYLPVEWLSEARRAMYSLSALYWGEDVTLSRSERKAISRALDVLERRTKRVEVDADPFA